MLTAIVGINWGDEGKGRMVDLLSDRYDIIARYQGGNNAGHTVINEKGKFILNLLPSGILRDETVNVMGNGMVIDIEHLYNEIKRLRDAGIDITPKHLKISDKATICMPYDKLLDGLEEDRLKDKKFGSTRRGIAPVYSDKYMKKTFRMGDLKHLASLKSKIRDIVEWKNLLVTAYGVDPVKPEDMYNWLEKYGTPFIDYVCDVGDYLDGEIAKGKSVMFEAQLGALRDIDFGIFPYTSSSSTIAAYAPIGAGIPEKKLDEVVGIMKAYSTCVGEGPFTCEMFGDEAEELRKAGGEYGAATGRPRRVGPFDCVASRYGLACQGADKIALTKLDVLSSMKEIPVITGYKLDDVEVPRFDTLSDLDRVQPVVTLLPGWNKDISGCKSWDELPKEAKAYVEFLEKQLGHEIQFVSTGAEREKFVLKGAWL